MESEESTFEEGGDDAEDQPAEGAPEEGGGDLGEGGDGGDGGGEESATV